jgi:probable HAF family extracellular repeat protein
MKPSSNSAVLSRSLAACLAAMSFTTVGVAASPQFSVLDLGALLGGDSYATGVNDLGEVTGYGQFETGGTVHGFLYSGGAMHDLGSVGDAISFGQAINNLGQVVGNYEPTGFIGDLPFFASLGNFTPLGTLDGVRGEATGINDAGDAVGTSYLPEGGPSRAVLYHHGNTIDLGSLGGRPTDASIGTAINNSGQITGYSSTLTNTGAAFLTVGGVMTELGSLGGGFSLGADVNEAGVVAGLSALPNSSYYHATRFIGGNALDLGTLGGTISVASSINGAGQIIGRSRLPGRDDPVGFFWEDGVMYNLNDLIPTDSGIVAIDLEGVGPNGINEAGQIAAFGVIDGEYHALLLTPVAVPEPGAAVLLATLGVICLGRRPIRSLCNYTS